MSGVFRVDRTQSIEQVKASLEDLTRDTANNVHTLRFFCHDFFEDVLVALGRMLDTNTSLRSLEFYFSGLGDTGISTVVEGVLRNKRVVNLVLANVRMGSDGAAAVSHLMRKSKALKSVSVEGNSLGDSLVAGLVASAVEGGQIEAFFAENNDLTLSGVKVIVELLKTRNTTLNAFGISHCFSLGLDGSRAFAGLISSDLFLKELRLVYCDFTDQGFALLAESLCLNKTLKVLNLKGSCIGAIQASLAVDVLKGNTTITELNLSNNFGVLGHSDIARGLLLSSPYLKTLHIAVCKISSNSYLELGRALCLNSSLTFLDLFGNRFTDKDSTLEFFRLLQKNSSLSRLWLPASRYALWMDECEAILLEGNVSLVECCAMPQDSPEKHKWDMSKLCTRNHALHSTSKARVMSLLLIRWCRQSELSVLPKDVVRMIARLVAKRDE